MVYRKAKRRLAYPSTYGGTKKRKNTMTKVQVLERKVNKMMKAEETKLYLGGNSTSAVNVVQNCVGLQLFDPSAGDTVNSRDGDKIIPKSCKINLRLVTGTSPSDGPTQFARVIVLRDTCGGATAPTATEMFGSATSTIGQEYLQTNRRKYDILYDKTVSLTQLVQTYWDGSAEVEKRYARQVLLTINPKVSAKPIYFNTMATTYDRGGLWLYVKGQSATIPMVYQANWEPKWSE